MNKKDKKNIISKSIEILSHEYPYANIQLNFESPFELLVSTILSAQCTDARVNKVTEKLFIKYNTPEQFAKLDLSKIEKLIFSTGYYKAKARHIQDASRVILDKFNGNVPGTMNELLAIPGVGRKTANVILGHIFDVPSIVVDTHVTRIVNLLGLVKTKNAEKIEFELMEMIDRKYWVIFTHYIINLGRNICIARRPKCDICKLNKICPSSFIK